MDFSFEVGYYNRKESGVDNKNNVFEKVANKTGASQFLATRVIKRPTYVQVVLIIVAFLFVFIKTAFADGGLLTYDNDSSQWLLHRMNRQICAINYENGFEKMLLSVFTDGLKGGNAVWIFPIPSKPEQTTIDIIKDFPMLEGFNVEQHAQHVVSESLKLMRLSQIYTLPFELFYERSRLKEAFMRSGGELAGQEGFEIHEHVEKMGLTTELVTTKNKDSFLDYVRSKNLQVPLDFESILEEYIGQDYSFAVSWVSDAEKFDAESFKEMNFNSLSVLITFPTKKIYFPLKSTKVYGDAIIPVTIYVVNHVTPELYPEIKNVSFVSYRQSQDLETLRLSPALLAFLSVKQNQKNINYTRILITAPAKNLLHDVWMNQRAPFKVSVCDFLIHDKNAWWVLFLFLLCSCLASLFAGIFTFSGDRSLKIKFMLIGLWNLFSIIGVIVAAFCVKINRVPIKENNPRNYKDRLLFVLLFSLIFLLLLYFFQSIFYLIIV